MADSMLQAFVIRTTEQVGRTPLNLACPTLSGTIIFFELESPS